MHVAIFANIYLALFFSLIILAKKLKARSLDYYFFGGKNLPFFVELWNRFFSLAKDEAVQWELFDNKLLISFALPGGMQEKIFFANERYHELTLSFLGFILSNDPSRQESELHLSSFSSVTLHYQSSTWDLSKITLRCIVN